MLGTPYAHSTEVYEYTQSIKDLGRGGVRIPTPEDAATTMLYNPAMLAFTKGFNWSILNAGVGAGCDTCQISGTTMPSLGGSLASYYGNNVWIGGEATSAMTFPYFGFAVYENYNLDILLQNPAYPTASMTGYQDTGYVIGGAVPLGPSLGFGVNLKQVYRTGGLVTISPAQLLAQSNPSASYFETQFLSGAGTGTGYGVDAGLMWKPDVLMNPIVSVCWQDIGYTPFYGATAAKTPPLQEDNLVLGLTAHQSLAGVGWGAGLEYRHINNIDVDISKKFNVGAELNLALIDIRAGFYQGWMGYGTTIDLWLLSLDAAYYSVERGAIAGQIQDSRVQVGLSFSASFDPSFIITDYGGKSHRLKQRR